MEGFEYVLNPPEIPRLAFGSTLEREVMPVKGPCMNSFMRSLVVDRSKYPGPQDYNIKMSLDKNFPSKLGFSSLVSTVPRMRRGKITNDTPVAFYDISKPNNIKPAMKPFNVGTSRTLEETQPTPGPGTYQWHVKRPEMNICSAFGSRRIIYPSVAVFCEGINTFACWNCGKISAGDFWHNFSTSLNLCLLCMQRKYCAAKTCTEKRDVSNKIIRELSAYSPARYCSFYHMHNNTKTAIATMPKKTLRHKITMENYLYRFITNNSYCRPKRN